MVKVRTSQIPEDSPIVSSKRKNAKKKFYDDERDELDDMLDAFAPDEDKKAYYKTLITLPEIGQSINPSYIQTIEKTFRVNESNYNYDGKITYQYGILINGGLTPSMNAPKGDIEIWYGSEEYRDQRYDKLMKVLDDVGIKNITI